MYFATQTQEQGRRRGRRHGFTRLRPTGGDVPSPGLAPRAEQGRTQGSARGRGEVPVALAPAGWAPRAALGKAHPRVPTQDPQEGLPAWARSPHSPGPTPGRRPVLPGWAPWVAVTACVQVRTNSRVKARCA